MPFPYVFTFYSYKGGVGRSMALMNVAYTLAGRGRQVLMVDMDLEAPGVSGFLHRSNELAEPGSAHPKDIVSLLSEAMIAARRGDPPEAMVEQLPPLSNYVRQIAAEKLSSLKPRIGELGRLDVLGTDLSRSYLERLADLNLKDLPQDQLLGLSRLLHGYFKAQVFGHRPLGVEAFEPPVSTPYDYVLVDSRTGITEIGGLCVGPLADRLVVVTGLNDQNVAGTRLFLEEVGIQPERRRQGDKPWDEVDPIAIEASESPSLGPKPTIVVASPVPSGEITYKRQRLGELEKELGIRPISLSYHPQMALRESVFVRDYSEEYLAVEYDRLATVLMAQVGDDPSALAARVGVLQNDKKDLGGAITWALRLTAHEPDVGVGILRVLWNATSESEKGELPQLRYVHAALSHDPRSRPTALGNWGRSLSEQAETKSGTEADHFFDEAYRKYTEAVRTKPDFPEALNNWGNALSYQAKTKSGMEADRLFEEASQKYSEAVRLKPDHALALSNWGIALYRQATAKAGAEADGLFEEAYRKYSEAVRLKPDFPESLNRWGVALSAQAKTKSGKEADQLFEETYGKYSEAVRLKPDFAAALSNWGVALYYQADTKPDEEADRLREVSRGKLLEAVRLGERGSLYNLACLEAKLGKAREAVHWLHEYAPTGAELSSERLAADRDFDAIRDQPEFVEFVESLPTA